MTCATPDVIASHGRPEHPSELSGLPCIIDTNVRFRANWPYRDGERKISVVVSGRVEANSPHAIASAARTGLGFCRVPFLVVEEDIAAGRLVPLLRTYKLGELGIYLVYPHRERMPAKLRAFITTSPPGSRRSARRGRRVEVLNPWSRPAWNRREG